MNPLKSAVKVLNNWFLMFVRSTFNPDLKYTSHLLHQWLKEFVKFFVYITVNGVILWFFLMAMVSLFPITGNYIRLGPGAWHILSIYLSGWFIWYLEKLYKYFRIGYKQGGIK